MESTWTDPPETEAPSAGTPPPKRGPGRPPKDQTTISRGPGRPPKDKKTEGEQDVSQSSLRSGLYGFFSTIAMLIRADVDWQEKDFEQMARGIMIAGKRIPQVLVMVANIMTPALALREFLMKVQDLANGRRKAQEKDAAEQAQAGLFAHLRPNPAQTTQPPNVNANYPGT